MAIDINLVTKQADEDPKKEKIKKVNTISLLFLLFIGFLTVVLFLINLRFSVNSIKAKQNDAISNLSSQDSTVSKIIYLNNRLDNISLILASRKKYNDVGHKIVDKTPPEVTIDEFAIDDTGITMKITSSSLLSLNDFLDSLLQLSQSKVLSSVSLDNLSISQGAYLMEIRMGVI